MALIIPADMKCMCEKVYWIHIYKVLIYKPLYWHITLAFPHVSDFFWISKELLYDNRVDQLAGKSIKWKPKSPTTESFTPVIWIRQWSAVIFRWHTWRILSISKIVFFPFLRACLLITLKILFIFRTSCDKEQITP